MGLLSLLPLSSGNVFLFQGQAPMSPVQTPNRNEPRPLHLREPGRSLHHHARPVASWHSLSPPVSSFRVTQVWVHACPSLGHRAGPSRPQGGAAIQPSSLLLWVPSPSTFQTGSWAPGHSGCPKTLSRQWLPGQSPHVPLSRAQAWAASPRGTLRRGDRAGWSSPRLLHWCPALSPTPQQLHWWGVG